MKKILILMAILLGGCGGTPYMEVSLGYQLNDYTDYWLQTEQTWQCDKNIQFNGELGMEWEPVPRHTLSAGAHHESWVLCGGPFNNMPEVDSNDIRGTYRYRMK